MVELGRGLMDEVTEPVSERVANIAHHARCGLLVPAFDFAQIAEAAFAGGCDLSECPVLSVPPLAQGCSEARVEGGNVFIHGIRSDTWYGVGTSSIVGG